MNIAIIGGGAAGFFSAIQIKENYPQADITIFEKNTKVLSKVKISGGGRCNYTNTLAPVSNLVKAYPRGKNFLKKAFSQFNNQDTLEWFSAKGIKPAIEADGCVFPETQDAQTIIDLFLKEARLKNITIITNKELLSFAPSAKGFNLQFADGDLFPFDKIIVTVGGKSAPGFYKFLADSGLKIEAPIPSLFSFKLANESLQELAGLVRKRAFVRLQGSKLKEEGELLITHWGISGPAVLKLSAFGAHALAEKNYKGMISINWTGCDQESIILEELQQCQLAGGQKMIINHRPFELQDRLWSYLCTKADLKKDKRWGEVGKKQLNRLKEVLYNDVYELAGKSSQTTEFVTCGGVSLAEVDVKTMGSKKIPGLYFAGEVLDIDGITGGFNFQAAWTTAYIAAKLQ